MTNTHDYYSNEIIIKEHIQALERFRQALRTRQVQQILASYDATMLDASQQLKAEERASLLLAQRFIKACQNNDDQAIIATVDAIQNSSFPTTFVFTHQEQQRILLAQQRKVALLRFRIAIASKRPEQILAAYNAPLLDDCNGLTQNERILKQLAQNFVHAYQSDNDQAIVAAIDAIHHSVYRIRLIFAVWERRRIELARQREGALAVLRVALTNKKIQPLAAAYNIVLDTSTQVTQEERKIVRLAQKFVLASYKDDDQALLEVYAEIKRVPSFPQYATFTVAEQQRLALAEQRMSA